MTQRYAALCAEIVIDSTNNQIVFSEGVGADLVATITPGTYFLTYDSMTGSLVKAITDALTAASALDATNSYIFSSHLGAEPNGNANAATLGQWAYLYIFANPYPTPSANIVFKWSEAACTFDPRHIGGDENGVDVPWIDDGSGSATRFVSVQCPVSVFVPDVCLADDDDPAAVADVVSHKSPTNARSHFVVSDIEQQKMLSWTYVEHDRVHPKADDLAFVGEEWGCLATFWAERIYRGGRIQVFAWESETGDSTFFDASDFLGTYVFVELPKKLPASRASQALKLYDVGPLLLAPYVS